MYTRAHACINLHTYTYTPIHIYILLSLPPLSIHAFTHTCIRTYIHTYTHAYSYPCSYTHHSPPSLQVPFGPLLPYIFMGEEISMSARLWTSGYDIFSPTTNVLNHYYVRRHYPKFWESVNRLVCLLYLGSYIASVMRILAVILDMYPCVTLYVILSKYTSYYILCYICQVSQAPYTQRRGRAG